MKYLRKYIRALLIEKGELRKQWSPGMRGAEEREAGHVKGVELKKWFRENADQQSLQKLMYIHWGTPEEIGKILQASYRGGNKNEINTSIHDPFKRLVPWSQDEMWDGDSSTVGIIIKGWVTFASNVDVDSGRLGNYLDLVAKSTPSDAEVIRHSGMGYEWPNQNKEFRKRASQQHKSSGVPKRPDVNSLERRFKLRDILNQIDDGKEDYLDEDDREFLDSVLLDDLDLEFDEFVEMRQSGDADQEGEAMQLATRAIEKLEDVFILSAEDFDPMGDWEMEDALSKGTLNWPEAILDNWKPIALVGEHLEMFEDLLWQANDYEVPLVDLDLDIHEDFYDEDFEARCDDYRYDDFEDAPDGWKEACEEEDYSKVWSHIKSPKI